MKRYGIFLLGVCFIGINNVLALEGDLMQSTTVVDNGNGTKTITGMIGVHKMDNAGNKIYICDNSNNCIELKRDSSESRTDMNKEDTMGENYNYDNLGVNATVPSGYNNIVIRDKNGNIVSSGELIDKHSTDAGIKIMGTQCDLRNPLGNRTDGDYAGFKTGANYSIVSVHDNVATDKGDVVTMYCVGISNKEETVNGYKVYGPGMDDVRCVFDSCGTLSKTNSTISPPKKDTDPNACKEGYGSLKSCSSTITGSINTCGGEASGSCNGSYETANVFKSSSTLNIGGTSCRLVSGQENTCKSASCGYNQNAHLNLSINLDNSKTYLAGTYFKNPSLISSVSVTNTLSGGTCPSWDYECTKNGNFNSKSECDARYNNTCSSCTKHYISEYAWLDEKGKACTPSGFGGFNWNNKLNGGNSSSSSSSTCNYTKVSEEWDGTFDCNYIEVTQGTPRCDANSRCESEMAAQGLFSYTVNGRISGTGTVKFETDSNSAKSSNKYELQFSNGNIHNKAYVLKKSGKVFYDLANVDVNNYNVYDNVHFIPLDFGNKTYYVDVVSNDLTINTGSSRFVIDLNTNYQCKVGVVNKFFPKPDPCVGEKCDSICKKEPCGYGFIYRSIDLNTPFPNSEIDGCVGSRCRRIGENWYTFIKNVDNQKRLSSTYSNSYDYVVYLDNEMISNIRKYNNSKNANNGDGYLDNSINVDGSSDFFKKNVAGICSGNNASSLCDKKTDYFGVGINEKWGK